MHKSLVLLALIALHLSAALSDPDRRISDFTMADVVACKEAINLTPKQFLDCRNGTKELDSEFHRCCLDRRRSQTYDNCLACAPPSPVEVANSNKDEGRALDSQCSSTHSIKCKVREGWKNG